MVDRQRDEDRVDDHGEQHGDHAAADPGAGDPASRRRSGQRQVAVDAGERLLARARAPAAIGWLEKRASWNRCASSPTGRGSTSRVCRNRTTNSVAVSAGRRCHVGLRGGLLEDHPALDDPVAYVGPGQRLSLPLLVPLDGRPAGVEVRQRIEGNHQLLVREPTADHAARARRSDQTDEEQPTTSTMKAASVPGPSRQDPGVAPQAPSRESVDSVGLLLRRCVLVDLVEHRGGLPLADDPLRADGGRPGQQERDAQRRHDDSDGAAQARGHPVTVPRSGSSVHGREVTSRSPARAVSGDRSGHGPHVECGVQLLLGEVAALDVPHLDDLLADGAALP